MRGSWIPQISANALFSSWMNDCTCDCGCMPERPEKLELLKNWKKATLESRTSPVFVVSLLRMLDCQKFTWGI